ncbi:DUF6625 family protein [Mesonia sediminis]|uniref:DUF6625 family protein n=1 Tax=Mesonia sediminis TaxID=1703946 RepID=A0ABW5SGI0_9FLAO
MKSILLIIPYFGKWPLWFEAYLKSIEKNPTINWLCPTDCEIPDNHPDNIKFLRTTLPELNKKVNPIVEAEVPLNPRKFCDLKPAYGEIFSKEVAEYDFWGICDMDIIWGDIRKFMTEDILNSFDMISSRKEAISGHFNLFRNTAQINSLYKKLPNYKQLFEVPEFKWTDEVVLTAYLKNSDVFRNLNIKVKWDSILCNQERGKDSHQEYHLDRWLWDNGKMINTKTDEEVMYLHFINWKRTMKFSEIKYKDSQQQFYISYQGMHYQSNTQLKHLLNEIKNFFQGYYVRLKKNELKKKKNTYLKGLKNKL